MPGKLEFEFSSPSSRHSKPQQNEPFVIQVLGNFGGQADQHPQDPSWLMQVPVRNVDLDNIEQLWASIGPRLDLDITDCHVCFEPAGLDDFHPDWLYQNLPVFKQLRQFRKRLLDPSTASGALSELLQSQPSDTQASTDNTNAAVEDGSQMFDRLLGESRPNAATLPNGSSTKSTSSGLDRLLQRAVAEHIVHQPDPRVDSAIDALDKASAETMRKILHHSEFQALEGAWRALYEFIYATEIGEDLILRVCSVSKQDLLLGLPKSAEALHESGLYQLLVGRNQRAADDLGISLLVCNYFFGGNADDIALLASCASMAELSGGAVIGAATSELLGCDSIALTPDFNTWSKTENQLWQQLRNSPMARHIGLALPRIFGRLPYGETFDKTCSFEFEEHLSADYDFANHEDFLWVNPSLYLAGLLAQSFTQSNWDMSPDDHTDIGGLPVYTYSIDGETQMLPTAEVLLPERSAVAVLQAGLMPIVSFRNRDLARLMRFQSIAEPVSALEGPW